MRSTTLRSPAKLNLFLRIINKRPDGYHNLKTLFERIDLCDTIRLAPNKTGAIRIFCSHPQVPKGPKNLAYRAAHILKEEYGVSSGVDIRITKRIPVAAGLAGGSSNAATVLLGLNQIWRLALNKKKLLHHGQALGSDISFFLHNCSWGIGVNRGDHIKAVPIPVKLWHILVIPCIKLHSGEVFARLNLQLTKTEDNVNILIHFIKNKNIRKIENLLSNDLESSILKIKPGLLRLKKRLQACRLEGSLFSGSGPAAFGVVQSRQQAEDIRAVLGKVYSRVLVVRTL
jgi:4-diphosphocytidyl-2-C-methyl-D-erythritol kinase